MIRYHRLEPRNYDIGNKKSNMKIQDVAILIDNFLTVSFFFSGNNLDIFEFITVLFIRL